MAPFIRRWQGRHRPKQYCAFTGEKAMIEHAFDRALDIAPAERVVTVIGRGHQNYLRDSRPINTPGPVVEQPSNRDTGPGVFLPLAKVMASDPDALVAIFPSDHFIHSRDRFKSVMEEAFELAERLPRQLVLLAARPDRAESEYGWIGTGPRMPDGSAHLIQRFQEKPGADEAEHLYNQGSLWNTMIIAAKASALWRLAWDYHPGMMARFESLKQRMGTASEAAAIASAYDNMPSVNFSRDLLERACDWSVALPMPSVAWCDWGNPDRMAQTLDQLGLEPAFPREILDKKPGFEPSGLVPRLNIQRLPGRAGGIDLRVLPNSLINKYA